jgi:hypothetical protein
MRPVCIGWRSGSAGAMARLRRTVPRRDSGSGTVPAILMALLA